MAAALAYRDWAITHPADFQLIYGNPIPGYEAPREITVPAASRSLTTFASMIAHGLASGEIQPPAAYHLVPPQLEPHFNHLIAQEGYPFSPAVIYIGVTSWITIHGVIMLELFNHLQPVVGDVDIFYRQVLQNVFESMGLKFR